MTATQHQSISLVHLSSNIIHSIAQLTTTINALISLVNVVGNSKRQIPSIYEFALQPNVYVSPQYTALCNALLYVNRKKQDIKRSDCNNVHILGIKVVGDRGAGRKRRRDALFHR